MPASLNSTRLLLILLGLVVATAVVGVVQNHLIGTKFSAASEHLDDASSLLTQTSTQLRAVAAGEDLYQDALHEEDNILVPPTEPLVDPEAPPGGTLRRHLQSNPAGFNWLIENSVDVAEIQDYVHDQFARPDFEEPDNWVPELAYKVEVNEDHTEYTVHLREGVYWQLPNLDSCDDVEDLDWLDGERPQMTSEDAKFYFEMAMHPEVAAAHVANYVQDIEEVEIIDDHTFKVHWAEPVYHSIFTTLGAYPLPKWLYERDITGNKIAEENIPGEFNSHWSNDCPIGTGPYTFEEFRSDDRVTLDLNPYYWDTAPPIESIEYRIVDDAEAAWNQLVAGTIDFLPSMSSPRFRTEVLHGDEPRGCFGIRGTSPVCAPQEPEADLDEECDDDELRTQVIDRFAYHYIGWNGDDPLFEDRKVRTAMTKAFNREGIIENVFNGLGELQSGPYYHDHPANNPDVEPLDYDLDRAAELLEEAGWTDDNGDGVRTKKIDGEEIEFEFTLTSYNRPDVRTWTEIYAEDLRSIGVHMSPDPVDWALMQRRMEEKNFDAFTGGWGLSWFIDPFQIWHSSQADIPRGSNRVGFRNDDADELIEELRATFDHEERLEMLRELHEIIHHEQAYTFFYAPQQAAAWSPRLQNMVFQQIRPQTFSLPWHITE